MVEILVPLSFFAMIFGIVAVVFMARSVGKKHLHETIREAVRAGSPLTPETVVALGGRRDGNSNLKSGAVLIAVALAFMVFGWTIDLASGAMGAPAGSFAIMAGIAAFPGFVGIALLVFGWLDARRDRREP
jgi:hypothetical protein